MNCSLCQISLLAELQSVWSYLRTKKSGRHKYIKRIRLSYPKYVEDASFYTLESRPAPAYAILHQTKHDPYLAKLHNLSEVKKLPIKLKNVLLLVLAGTKCPILYLSGRRVLKYC